MKTVSSAVIFLYFMLHAGASCFATTCHTAAPGEWENLSNWDCGCNPSSCDTLVVHHAMTTNVDTLSIPVQRLIVEESGSISGHNFQIYADVYNHGLITGHWIRFAGIGAFVNSGTVRAYELLAIQDSCVNHGHLAVSDSLVIGYYKDFWNYNQINCNVIYNLNFLVNVGALSYMNANWYYGQSLNNEGKVDITSMLHTLSGLTNDGTIHAGYIKVDHYGCDNRGTIFCTDTMTIGNGIHSASSELFQHSRIEAGHFVNRTSSVIQGGGALCISGFSKNEGTIRTPLRICDTSPTSAEWPYLDVNTGTVLSGVNVCTSGYCSVGLDEQTEGPGMKIYPNPSTDGFTIAFDGLPAGSRTIALHNAVGQIVYTAKGPFPEKVVIPRNRLRSGMYRLSVQEQDGREGAAFRVVIIDP